MYHRYNIYIDIPRRWCVRILYDHGGLIIDFVRNYLSRPGRPVRIDIRIDLPTTSSTFIIVWVRHNYNIISSVLFGNLSTVMSRHYIIIIYDGHNAASKKKKFSRTFRTRLDAFIIYELCILHYVHAIKIRIFIAIFAFYKSVCVLVLC